MLQKNALVVGIADYRDFDMPLPGAATDLREWTSLLGKVGFSVCALGDQAATKKAILDGLRHMISRPRSNNVFVFAGHGTHVAGPDGVVTDGLVAFPSSKSDSAHTYVLLDKELIRVMRSRARDARVTLILDCCYAEAQVTLPDVALTGTPKSVRKPRMRPGRRTRFLPVGRSTTGQPPSEEESLAFAAGSEPIVIAATRQKQRAFEDDNLEPGTPHGVFSYYATRELLRNPNLSARELEAAIRPQVARRNEGRQVVIVPTNSGRESQPFL